MVVSSYLSYGINIDVVSSACSIKDNWHTFILSHCLLGMVIVGILQWKTFRPYQLLRVMVMVFNATFSVILWWSVFLVEETGVPGENYRPTASLWHTFIIPYNVVPSTAHHE
jgi:hypothetical protein